MMKHMVLVDGHNLLFRYFQGMPRTIYAADGRLMHGAYGMIAAILRAVQQWTPTNLLVCFDSPTPSDRLELSAEYKGNRVQVFDPNDPNNPFTQIDMVKNALDVLAIPWIEVTGVEADDLIGSYLHVTEDAQTIILSTDRDFLQLVTENVSLSVWRGKQEKRFTPSLVLETFGVLPEQFVEYRALMGDASDNIRGVPGIGPKTAAMILETYKTLENVYNHLPELKPRLAEVLHVHQELVMKNRQLITIRTDFPVDRTVFNAFSLDLLKGMTVRQVFIRLGLFRERASVSSESLLAQKTITPVPLL